MNAVFNYAALFRNASLTEGCLYKWPGALPVFPQNHLPGAWPSEEP